MNKQRQILVTVTYNDLGCIIDTKAEPYAEPEQQWIPGNERIPEGLIIVQFNDGDFDLLQFPTDYRRKDIVAWMPLPEPWKGEQP